MAKIVIAGKADCPYYAKAELLGDRLCKNLPDFEVHRIVKTPQEWETWLDDTCSFRGWEHQESPLVWRELVDRGGKGVLIGGCNEFQEYANGYYGVKSTLVSDDLRKIASENLKTKLEIDDELRALSVQHQPLYVCITNANSSVAYSMINTIGQGLVFGPDVEIALNLMDSEDNLEPLEGVRMEAVDLGHKLLTEISVIPNAHQAFMNCNTIVLLDEIDRAEEEDEGDWLRRNASLFENYGRIINDVADKNVKVLICGNGPINFNCSIFCQNAPNLQRQNIAGLSRQLENNAKALVAKKLNVNSAGVVDLVVWGNIHRAHFTDLSKTRVHGYDGAIWGPPFYSVPAMEVIYESAWVGKEFPEMVKNRRDTIADALKHRPSASEAAAITTQLHHWWNGSTAGQVFSLVVYSEGWYGVPEGTFFSFPVQLHSKGFWSIVQDYEMTEEMTGRIKEMLKDIEAERDTAFPRPDASLKASNETVVSIRSERDSPVVMTTDESAETLTSDNSNSSNNVETTALEVTKVSESNEDRTETGKDATTSEGKTDN